MSDIRGLSFGDQQVLQRDIEDLMTEVSDDERRQMINKRFWLERGLDDFSMASMAILSRKKTSSQQAMLLSKVTYDLIVQQKLHPTTGKQTLCRVASVSETEAICLPLKKVACAVSLSCPTVFVRKCHIALRVHVEFDYQRRLDSVEFELQRMMSFNDVSALNAYDTLKRELESAERALIEFGYWAGRRAELVRKRDAAQSALNRMQARYDRASQVVANIQELMAEQQKLRIYASTKNKLLK